MKTLKDVKVGQRAVIEKLHGEGALKRRIMDMSLTKGTEVYVRKVAPLGDPQTTHCVRAERAFSRALGGSCQVPLGAYAVLDKGELWLRGFVATPDAGQMVCGEQRGTPADDEALGQILAQQLREQGADNILRSLVR